MSSASSPSLELPLAASRWLRGGVLVSAALAAVALALSAAPWPAWLLLPVLAVHAWRQASGARAARLCLGSDSTAVLLDASAPRGSGAPVALLSVAERGPLLVLAWREAGRVRRHAFGPDTLGAAERRRLRLWWQGHRGEHAQRLPGLR